MITLSALYRLAEEENIAVDCYKLKKREALSIMDDDGICYIAIDPFKLENETDEKVKLADKWSIKEILSMEDLDVAVADGYTDIWSLAEHFGVTEDFMRKAVCWYTHGNLATELYF